MTRSRCEEAGFDFIGVPDTQASIYRDLSVAMTAAVLNTRRAQIASMVTNPVTRHPAVTANAFARLAVDENLRASFGERSRELAQDWGYGPSVEGFHAAVREAVAHRGG